MMPMDDFSEFTPLTEAESIEAVQWSMKLKVGKIKMGRQRFDEAMILERGLSWFGEEVAKHLRLCGIVFLKRPQGSGDSAGGAHQASRS